MHPTLTLPVTGRITPTDEQIAHMRAYVLAQAGDTARYQHGFAEHYLTSVIRGLASGIPADLVHTTITQALALIAVVEQLDAEHYLRALSDSEQDGFNTIGREDPETGEALPAGVGGFSLGRYAR